MNMDQFITNQQHCGKLQLEEGSFSLNQAAALQKLQCHRVNDVTFPYWKLLQAGAVLEAERVNFKVKTRGIHIEIEFRKELPGLASFCNELPCDDMLLEALKSSAMAISSGGGNAVWTLEKPQQSTRETAILESGTYQSSTMKIERARHQTEQYNRLSLRHQWSAEGSFWTQLKTLLQLRHKVQASLTQKTDFYPVLTYHSGRLWVLPALEPHSPDRTYSGGWAGKELFYAIDRGDNPDRFLTEGLYGSAYDHIFVCNSQGQSMGSFATPYDKDEAIRDLRRLVIETDHSLESSQFHDINLGPMYASPIRSTRSRFSRACPAFYCSEALMTCLETKREHGWIGIVDRGLLVQVVEADFGLPGALLLVGRGNLKMDIGGTSVVQDEAWKRLLAAQRIKSQERLSFLKRADAEEGP